nr:MAG TPA: hypothetical protein [Caudoviricetes sp.]
MVEYADSSKWNNADGFESRQHGHHESVCTKRNNRSLHPRV